jgi:hypothetical protein
MVVFIKIIKYLIICYLTHASQIDIFFRPLGGRKTYTTISKGKELSDTPLLQLPYRERLD